MLFLHYYRNLYMFQVGFWLIAAAFILCRRSSPRIKVILLAFATFALCRNYAFMSLGNSPFVPDLPETLIRVWTWADTATMAFIFLSIICLFLGFIHRWLRPPTLVIFLIASAITTIGMRNDMELPRITERTLEYAKLPPALDGYKILHLSDLHCSSASGRWRTIELVRLANSTRPDLICVTGDIADGDKDKFFPVVEPLVNLRAPDGVYYITGNHEYFRSNSVWGPNNQWMSTYRCFGMRFLNDECVHPRPELALGGMSGDQRRKKEPVGIVTNIYATATNGEFRILLHHYGRFFNEYVERAAVQLMLAGDTHGGFLPGRLNYLIDGRKSRGYFRGFYPLANGDDTAWLNVSPGVGQWAPFPLRFFNPPEMTLITLRRRAAQ